jgi:hypothetical protein
VKRADLTAARLDGARIHGTLFQDATWTDGSTCGPGSISRCAPALDADPTSVADAGKPRGKPSL